MNKIVPFLFLCILSGCASKPLPTDMAPMAQIYDEHFQETRTRRMELKDARERISRPLKNNGTDLDGYTRDAYNEIQGIFPELPNPTLVMYIYPHLAENGSGPSCCTQRDFSPVPGYATTFRMYERTQYALPGEMAGRGDYELREPPVYRERCKSYKNGDPKGHTAAQSCG